MHVCCMQVLQCVFKRNVCRCGCSSGVVVCAGVELFERSVCTGAGCASEVDIHTGNPFRVDV